MGKNTLLAVLIGCLFLSVLATAGLAYFFVSGVRDYNRLRNTEAQINYNLGLARSLGAEAVEYSKKNPAIDPVLQSCGLKPAAGQK